jgi:hypothetical protein
MMKNYIDKLDTLLKFPKIREIATGSSVNEVLIILPIPSGQGISLIIFIVMGLVEISNEMGDINLNIYHRLKL